MTWRRNVEPRICSRGGRTRGGRRRHPGVIAERAAERHLGCSDAEHRHEGTAQNVDEGVSWRSIGTRDEWLSARRRALFLEFLTRSDVQLLAVPVRRGAQTIDVWITLNMGA